MDWQNHFTNRFDSLKEPITSQLIDLYKPNNLISFAGGLPAKGLLPGRLLNQVLTESLQDDVEEALQYGDELGAPRLRELLAQRMNIAASKIAVTSGSQQALSLLGEILFNPCDAVGIFLPCYMGAFRAWSKLGLQFIPLERNNGAVNREQVARVCKQGLKALYLVPNYDNPSGETLTASDRNFLVSVARRNDIVIIEDDAYQELGFHDAVVPSLYSLDDERVIHLRTFAKTVAPGLRLGWLAADEAFLVELAKAKLSLDYHPSTLAQSAILRLLQTDDFNYSIENLRRYYSEKAHFMHYCLQKELHGLAEWTMPSGGFYFWIHLHEIEDTLELLPHCIKAGISFMPGSLFYPNTRPSKSLRLCFSTASHREIKMGIEILATICRARIQECSTRLFA